LAGTKPEELLTILNTVFFFGTRWPKGFASCPFFASFAQGEWQSENENRESK